MKFWFCPTLAYVVGCSLVILTLARPHPPGAGNDPSRPCLHYEGDGCSIPFGLPFFYKTQFTLSCDRHDVCYHCGAAYNITRPSCDQAFRKNTLSTCKKEYLKPRLFEDTERFSFQSFHLDDKEELPPHQNRFLQAVDEHGLKSLETIFLREVRDFQTVHPEAGLKQFVKLFSNHDMHVKMLAEWVTDLSRYLQIYDQKDASVSSHHILKRRSTSFKSPSSQNTRNFRSMSVESPSSQENLKIRSMSFDLPSSQENINLRSSWPNKAKFDQDKSMEFNWCTEVSDYLKAQNETIPSSAGLVCADIKYLTCNFFSEAYFLAVRIFANSSYDRPAEFYCHQSWVTKCLPLPPRPTISKSLKFIPGQ